MIDSSSTVFIEKFHRAHDKYKHISPEEMKLICHAEFAMMKEVMNSNTLEEVRLQYLFVIRASPSRVVTSLMNLYKRKDSMDKINMLENYIRENPLRFKKYKEKLKNLL